MFLGNILRPKKKSSSTNVLQYVSNFKQTQQSHQLQQKFNLEFSKVKDRTNVQNSKNPLIKNLVKMFMKQIASNLNAKTHVPAQKSS
jgi:hypothetical protein